MILCGSCIEASLITTDVHKNRYDHAAENIVGALSIDDHHAAHGRGSFVTYSAHFGRWLHHILYTLYVHMR